MRGMPVDARERADKGNIALIVAMVSLLRWSGRRLAMRLTEGVRTIGCVEPSSVFRPLAEPTEPLSGSTDSSRATHLCILWTHTFPNLPLLFRSWSQDSSARRR